MFGETINLLFRQVKSCEGDCDVFYQTQADSMKDKSFELAIYWIVIALGCVVGNMFTFFGFGMYGTRCEIIKRAQMILRLFITY